MTNIRHGDINLSPTNEVKGKKIKHNGSHIVAWGEATGHNHTVKVKNPNDMEVYQDGETFYMTLKVDGTITHQEHKELVVPAGTYKTVHEKEFDWFSMVTRKVID